jgi:hypothetical protein
MTNEEDAMARMVVALSLLGVMLIWGCSDDDDNGTKDSQVNADAAADTIPGGDTASPDQAVAQDAVQADTAQGDAVQADAAQGDAAAVKLSSGVQPIFTVSCASASCHGGSSPKGGMDLTSGSAHAALVGVTSLQCSSLKRVEAGSPSKSYLVQKIEGSGSCFVNQKMPIGGSLTSPQIATIKAWIKAGAAND